MDIEEIFWQSKADFRKLKAKAIFEVAMNMTITSSTSIR